MFSSSARLGQSRNVLLTIKLSPITRGHQGAVYLSLERTVLSAVKSRSPADRITIDPSEAGIVWLLYGILDRAAGGHSDLRVQRMRFAAVHESVSSHSWAREPVV